MANEVIMLLTTRALVIGAGIGILVSVPVALLLLTLLQAGWWRWRDGR